MDYDATKSGVDNIDQMARLYSVIVSCSHKSLHVLHLAMVNAVIVYREVTDILFC